MVLPPADQVQQRMCSEWYNKQSDTFSVPVGMSASICQIIIIIIMLQGPLQTQ
jgi:hypothetical protein